MNLIRLRVVLTIAIFLPCFGETKPIVPPLTQTKDFIFAVLKASNQCPVDQFLSEGSGACEDCSTHCVNGMASQNCLQQCHGYFADVERERLRKDTEKYKNEMEDYKAATNEEFMKLKERNKEIEEMMEQKNMTYIIILAVIGAFALLLGPILTCILVGCRWKARGQNKKGLLESSSDSTKTLSTEASSDALIQQTQSNNREESTGAPLVEVHLGQGSVKIGTQNA